MSKIALTPNASGSGTFTIAAPNSNTDRTLTLPDEAGTVLTSASDITQNSGPAFAAYKSVNNQALTTAQFTQVLFQTEVFDTDSCYDTSTSRFTPNVAGYYQLNTGCDTDINTTSTLMIVAFYKSGSQYVRGMGGYFVNEIYLQGSTLMYFNGTTDYATVSIYTSNASNNPDGIYSGSVATWFSGSLVRAA